MQSNTEKFWILSKEHFSPEGLGEMIFGENIKQTMLVKLLPDEKGWVGGAELLGWIDYETNNVEIPEFSVEAKRELTLARVAAQHERAPQRELIPAVVRPHCEERTKKARGIINFYKEEYRNHLRVFFITGRSKLCQFSYHLNRLGFYGKLVWKPSDVTSFEECWMISELEEAIFARVFDNFKTQLSYLQAALPAMHCNGVGARVRGSNGVSIDLLEAIPEITHRGDKVNDLMVIPQYCSKSDILRLEALMKLIENIKEGDYESSGKIVDDEVAKWPQAWKDAIVWLGDNAPFHSSFDFYALDFEAHPILNLFVRVGIIRDYDLDNKRMASVKPVAAALLSAVTESLQNNPNVGDGVI